MIFKQTFYKPFLQTYFKLLIYKILTKFLQNSYKILTKFLQAFYKLFISFLQTSDKLLALPANNILV